jgi:hypothetical protein
LTSCVTAERHEVTCHRLDGESLEHLGYVFFFIAISTSVPEKLPYARPLLVLTLEFPKRLIATVNEAEDLVPRKLQSTAGETV